MHIRWHGWFTWPPALETLSEAAIDIYVANDNGTSTARLTGQADKRDVA